MYSQSGARTRNLSLTGECSSDWAIRLPDTLMWLSLNSNIHPHKFEIHFGGKFSLQGIFSDQPSFDARPHVGAKCHKLRKMCSQAGLKPGIPGWQGLCTTDWAINLLDTLTRLYWQSPNCDIHPHKFEIRPRISEVNFHCERLHFTLPVYICLVQLDTLVEVTSRYFLTVWCHVWQSWKNSL